MKHHLMKGLTIRIPNAPLTAFADRDINITPLLEHSSVNPSDFTTPITPVSALGEEVKSVDGLVRSRLQVSRRNMNSQARVSPKASSLHSPYIRTPVDTLQTPRALRAPLGAGPLSANGWRRLPVEILTEIFTHCLPSKHIIPPSSLIMEAPLVLLSVCREWRTVALSTPRLWCSPRIHLPSSGHLTDAKLKPHHTGIEQWLDRSGSLPLFLSLMIHRGPQSESAELGNDTLELIASLMQCSHRLVDLTIFSSSTMYDFLQSTVILETEFPALKSMTVVHSTVGRHPTEDSTLSSLMSISKKSMPKLEKFCLCGFNSAVIGHLTRTHSWSPNIKHLVLCSSSGMSVLDGWRLGPADILSILSQNPQLSSFHAAVTLNSDYRIYGLLQLSDSVFNLPSLLHLNLQFMVPPNDALHAHPDPDMHHLFKCISCPSLKTLSVAYAGVPSLTEVPFLPWLSDPKVSRIDKLRELNLSISMTPTALTECLILLPSSLRVLEIVDLGQIDVDSTGTMFGHTVRDSHLDLLTRNDSQDNSHLDVCPNLKIFRLIISRFLVSTCLTPRASDSDVSETQLKRKKNMGVSRAVLQRFIDSRTQSTGNGTRKARTIRECEVLLSPTSSTYYKLDSL